MKRGKFMGTNRKVKKWAGVLIILILLIVLTVKNAGYEKQCIAEMNNITVLSSESEFRTALNGEPQTCIVENATLTGYPVKDLYDIFNDEMIYICGDRQLCKRDNNSRRWRNAPDNYDDLVSTKNWVYSDVEIPLTSFRISGYPNDLKKYCKSSVTSKIEGTFYYPKGDLSKRVGNVRHNIECIPQNSKVTFIAVVGNDSVSLKGLSVKNNAKLVIGGSADSLKKEYTTGYRSTTYAAWLIGIVSIFFILILGSDRARARRRR